MLDLETMGTNNNAVVVAIGAVFFDPVEGALGSNFYTSLGDWESQIRAGAVMDSETVQWWLGAKDSSPNDDARKDLFKESADTISALFKFMDFVQGYGANVNLISDVKMWGNGVDFDNVILRNCYNRMHPQALALKAPWKYPNSRCFRTLKNEFKGKKPEQRGLVRHNALDDAIYQAKWAINIYQTMRTNANI